mmetsp:Transcript_22349/g.56684  ORF Transcript_22349/g.56684 Transcript_22349/m.56684 type:complete len:239 (-) Transcript_22349:638-1354(-)
MAFPGCERARASRRAAGLFGATKAAGTNGMSCTISSEIVLGSPPGTRPPTGFETLRGRCPDDRPDEGSRERRGASAMATADASREGKDAYTGPLVNLSADPLLPLLYAYCLPLASANLLYAGSSARGSSSSSSCSTAVSVEIDATFDARESLCIRCSASSCGTKFFFELFRSECGVLRSEDRRDSEADAPWRGQSCASRGSSGSGESGSGSAVTIICASIAFLANCSFSVDAYFASVT